MTSTKDGGTPSRPGPLQEASFMSLSKTSAREIVIDEASIVVV